MTTPEPVRGMLHPGRAEGLLTLRTHPPSPRLAPLVEFHWIVRWDLRGQPPHEQKVLSHPNVHLVFEEPRAAVYGVDRGLFIRRLEGCGQVLGVKFCPGGFRGYWSGPVQELSDRVTPAATVLGPEVDALTLRILALDDQSAMVVLAEEVLLARLPEPDRVAAEVAAMVDTANTDRSLVRVEQLAERCGTSVRTLRHLGPHPATAVRRVRGRKPQMGAAPGAAAGGRNARRHRHRRLAAAGSRPRLRRPVPPHP